MEKISAALVVDKQQNIQTRSFERVQTLSEDGKATLGLLFLKQLQLLPLQLA